MSLERLRASLSDRYRLERELGQGGMATVYLAHDLKHERDVAIKVLHPDLGAALGSDRFLAEIRTTARLQHPHILPLLDSGQVEANVESPDSRPTTYLYYVMPLVTGETLRARLERERQLPIADAVRIAREVASALDYAHRQGVIHRDIKPENILLHDGQALVADFGIALAVQSAGGARMTQTGLSLGTPQYMSPEQAMGEKQIDARSDVYALAAVTYEMLAGDAPFSGGSVQAIVAKIMTEKPTPLHTLRDTVPEHVEEAVLTGLAKLPADRFASAAEFATALATSTGVRTTGTRASAAPRSRLGMGVAMLGAAALLGAGWWLGRQGGTPTERWTAYTQLTDATGEESAPTLSPDGESFAYTSNARGTWDIYVQRVGGRNPIVVAGDSTLDERGPAYSPDGRQIAFSVGGGGLFVMGATGESPRRLTSVGSDPAWSPDGQRLAFGTEEVTNPYVVSAGQILIVDVGGGEPAHLIGDPSNTVYQPSWSPSGSRVAYWVERDGVRDIATVAAAGGEQVLVTDDRAVDWAPTWSPDGHHLYFASDRGGTMGIWRIGVDESSGRPRGAPELVVAGVDVAMDRPQLSRDGETIIFRSRLESVNPAAVAFDPATERIGAVTLLQQRSGNLAPTDISPDGAWLALYNSLERQQDIFLMRSDGRDLTRLTDDIARDWLPRFTPDGEALVFYSNQRGPYDGWLIRRDGSGRTQLSDFGSAGGGVNSVFAPDGKRLLIVTSDSTIAMLGTPPWPVSPETATRLTGLDIAGGRMLPSQWSPDGRWLTGVVRPPSGGYRGNAVYDMEAGRARAMSSDGTSLILGWLPGSRRVVYFTESGALVVQDIASLERRVVSPALPYPPDQLGNIVVARDGKTLYYGARQVESNIWMVRRVAPEGGP